MAGASCAVFFSRSMAVVHSMGQEKDPVTVREVTIKALSCQAKAGFSPAAVSRRASRFPLHASRLPLPLPRRKSPFLPKIWFFLPKENIFLPKKHVFLPKENTFLPKERYFAAAEFRRVAVGVSRQAAGTDFWPHPSVSCPRRGIGTSGRRRAVPGA